MNTKYISNFLKGIELKEKTILDIGCGNFRLLDYFTHRGMNIKHYVGIDPNTLRGKTKVMSHELLKTTFQDYLTTEKFDIIILHDSINHLDENACINLQGSLEAREHYWTIFNKVYSLLKVGGKLIIADASPENFWYNIHMTNPFDSSIEWHKHQKPEVWIKLLSECGFKNHEISWLTPQKLLPLDFIIRNKWASYFLVSHFKLIMDK